MAKLFSSEWFDMVENAVEAAGDLNVPDALASLVLNVTVSGTEDGDVEVSMNGGVFQRGHADGAATTISLPYELAHKMFIENDQAAGMQGFMSGQIKVEGDMSKLMAMQSVSPSAEQIALQKTIMENTEG